MQFDPPLVIAHRGASSEAPENTLSSFRRAVECFADGVEFDVRLSSDGVPVVFHDETLERTTNGHGRLSDHSLRELRALDAGGWFSRDYRGEKIPTLLEAMVAMPPKHISVIELKAPDSAAARLALARAVARDLRRAGERACVVTSFERGLIETIHGEHPELSLALNLETVPGPSIRLSAPVLSRLIALCPDKGIVTAERTEKWQMCDRWVFAWTADTTREWRRLHRAGVDGIMTNRPLQLRDWLSRQPSRTGRSPVIDG